MPTSSPGRRSAVRQRKGDVREQQILDAAEDLLATHGFARMTVGDIAAATGITRAALYFYFASKQDVVTALVARATVLLEQKSESLRDDTAAPEAVFATALGRTAELWREHGAVMRAAVDLSSTVTEIDQLWTRTADVFIDAIAGTLRRAGVSPGDGPGDAQALARALCWMIERSFYQAARVSPDEIEQARQTCLIVWTRLTTWANASGNPSPVL
ncbi:TetR/AcrR family transcriptional regulator [Mycobacterium sp. NPDC006124]|uniref:TetR/AcrR family transcriptional regulator n=1 Tax=Mycobacterium sp. NPDC006124 TaxID=3156729 RepID=UPI0033B85567